MKKTGFSFRSLMPMFLIAFLVWSSNMEGCHARKRRHWAQNRGDTVSLFKKKGKSHGSKPKSKTPTTSPKDHPTFAPVPVPSPKQSPSSSSVFNVLDFGAKGDGTSDDTKAFQGAWAAACKVKASMVVVPSEYEFLVGPISFSGPYCEHDIVFQLDGTIMAPTSSKAWGSGLLQWLEFTKLVGLTIQGTGIIDGRGSVWWDKYPYTDPEYEELDPLIPFNETQDEIPPIQINSAEIGKMPSIKPTAVRFYGSFNVTVTGITIQNSPQCHLKFDNCMGVSVHNIATLSPGDSPNTDGIHLQNSRDVLIRNSNLACGDDCVSIQTGCTNVYIHDVNCGPGHGISIGGLGRDQTKACVSNITVRNVVMKNTMNGVRIKTWQGGSGSVKGVLFSNIQVSEVEVPIVIDQYYCDKTQCMNHTLAVGLSGITFENIRGTYTVKAAHLSCSNTVPCTDVTLTNLQLQPLQEHNRMYDPFCWQSFGELNSPTIPPINCLQLGKPSSNHAQTDADTC